MRIDPGVDHYGALGLRPGASQKEIKRAYRALAKVHHPDRGAEDEKFKSITLAYHVLTSPVLKARYDTLRGALAAGRRMTDVSWLTDELDGKEPVRISRWSFVGLVVLVLPLGLLLAAWLGGASATLVGGADVDWILWACIGLFAIVFLAFWVGLFRYTMRRYRTYRETLAGS